MPDDDCYYCHETRTSPGVTENSKNSRLTCRVCGEKVPIPDTIEGMQRELDRLGDAFENEQRMRVQLDLLYREIRRQHPEKPRETWPSKGTRARTSR